MLAGGLLKRGRVRLLILPVVFALLATACGSTQYTTPLVGASVFVNHESGFLRQLEAPVELADNQHPSRVFLWATEVVTGHCRFYVSDDNGYSWRSGTAPSLSPYTDCGPGSSQPLNFRTTMAQAPDGTLYVAYAAHDDSAGGSRSALLARSTDSGTSWQVVTVDAAPKATDSNPAEIDFEPHVAIDPNNTRHIIVIFRRSYPSSKIHPTRPYIATSNDGGATFTTPTLLFDRAMGFDPPYPVIRNNTLYISWHEPISKGPDKIWFSSSTDGGKTFTDHLVTQSSNVDTPVPLWDSVHSKWLLFWDDGATNLNVHYATSSDGSSWSSPKRLNDEAKSVRDHLMPAVSESQSGRIDVDWYDYRNDPYPVPKSGNIGNRNDVFSSSSTDGGVSWTPNVKLSDLTVDRLKGLSNNEFFVQVPPAIASADTWAVGAWSDTRNGDEQTSSEDIYAAPMAFDSSSIPSGKLGAQNGYTSGDLVLVGVILGVAGLLAGAGVALLLTRRTREAKTTTRV
jgi:hypothetical protein